MLVKRTSNYPNIFDDLLRDLAINTSNESKFTYPAVNIYENEKEYNISFAVPGMNKNDFNIDIADNIMTVSVERESEKEEEIGNYLRKEFNYQTFSRSFNLPKETVNEEKVKATYKKWCIGN